MTSRVPEAPTREDAIAAVRRLEEIEWGQAARAKDTAWFAHHLAGELVVTTGRTGRVTGKAEEMADILATGNASGADRVDELQIQVHGNVAIATFRLTTAGTDRTGPYQRTARYTEVWVHRAGRWQLTASHSSLIPAAGSSR